MSKSSAISSPPVVIVDGGTATAVGLAKCLVAAGYTPVCLAVGDEPPLAASVRGARSVAVDALDDRAFALIHALGDPIQRGALFCASDSALIFIDSYRNHLAARWAVSASIRYSMAHLLNKNEMRRLALEAGFTAPDSVVIGPTDNRMLARSVPTPAILKPLDSLEGGKSDFAVASDWDEIDRLLARRQAAGKTSLVQEYVDPNGEGLLVEIFALHDPARMSEAVLIGARKDRICPPRIGSSSAIATVPIETSERAAVQQFYDITGFSGLIDFELIRWCGRTYFIEANYRAGTPIALTAAAGLNLPAQYAQLVTTNTPPSPGSVRLGVSYVREPFELQLARAGHLSPFEAIVSFLRAEARLLVDRRHPGVAINYVRQKMRRRRATQGTLPPGASSV